MKPILVIVSLIVATLSSTAPGINSCISTGQENSASPNRPVVIEASAAANALDVFQAALNERWSYRYANQANFDDAIASLRKRIGTGISSDEFGIELQKIIALGIDGHSGVTGYSLPPGGCLPFLIEALGERFVAITADRKAFLVDGFPYVAKLDGKPVAIVVQNRGRACAEGLATIRQGSLPH